MGRKKKREREERMMDKPRPLTRGRVKDADLMPTQYTGPVTKEWKVVIENQLLVHKIVRKQFAWATGRYSVCAYEDLVQAGLMGLHHAVELFDPKLGFKLSTYAYNWIYQYVMRCWRDEGFRCVRTPSYLHDKFSELRRRYGVNMNLDQLYNQNKIDEATWKTLQVLSKPLPAYELDAPVSQDNEDGATFADFILFHEHNTLFDTMEHMDMHAIVIMMTKKLSGRAREVIELRYGLKDGEERTLKQVGKIMGVSHERIRQIEAVAITNMFELFKGNTVLLEDLENVIGNEKFSRAQEEK